MDEQLSIEDLRCKARYNGQVYDVASIHLIKRRVLLTGGKGLISANFGNFELLPADYESDEEPTDEQVMELGSVAYSEGLEPDEVARRMGISVKTVYSKKHKIQRRLVSLLAEQRLAA